MLRHSRFSRVVPGCRLHCDRQDSCFGQIWPPPHHLQPLRMRVVGWSCLKVHASRMSPHRSAW